MVRNSVHWWSRLYVSHSILKKSDTNIIITATVVIMILRIWAMYHRSRPILRIFLMLFSLEIISAIIADAMNSDPKILSGMYMPAV